jgi:hypothetical protein
MSVSRDGFEYAAEVIEFLTGSPSPEETLQLRPSESFESRIQELLEKNRVQGLNAAEEEEWARYEFIEHLIVIARVQSLGKLGAGADVSAPGTV